MTCPFVIRFAIAASLVGLATACTRPNKIWACQPDQTPAVHPERAFAKSGIGPYMHSHNDYAHPLPFWDAIDKHVGSLEADITLEYGRLTVGHNVMPTDGRGTLQELYLDRLKALVQKNGDSVYGDGTPVYLVLDIREANPDLPPALRSVLHDYADILTEYTDTSMTTRAVTVILSGDDDMKRAALDYPVRYASRDSGQFSLDDPPIDDNRWTAYALNWNDYFYWNGSGPMSEDDSQNLGCLVENTAATGRTLRLWDAPDSPDSWAIQVRHGVRFINSDNFMSVP
jgi:hypothetical protein